jgi:hypothetical protein
MKNEDLDNYLSWVYLALLGRTANSDQIYSNVGESIDRVSRWLMAELPTKVKTLYRGILVEDKYVKEGRLIPMEKLKSLSFSENLREALIFADPMSEMSQIVMAARPECKGYIIQYIPEETEILYHYSWMPIVPIKKVFIQNGYDTHLLDSQKEVIIKQTMKDFSVRRFNEFL